MAVTPNMKIAEVLKRYPQLLDVLIAQSPHFGRLRNPILRRLQGRMVNVAQAAAIGGLDPTQLVHTLNAALGENEAPVGPIKLESMADKPRPPWLDGARVASVVDVREEQVRGQEPFAKIMAGVDTIDVGEILLLRNTFEPLPLYDVLAKRGFLPWARRLGAEDWEIYLYKVTGERRASGSEAQPRPQEGLAHAAVSETRPSNGPVAADDPAFAITVDVRGLTPPQPMMRILDALDRLKPGETLLVHHVRRPVYLYPKLAELGYKHETRELGPDRVDIVIKR